MKSVLSTILAASVTSIGLVGVSTTDALAKGPKDKETEANIFCTDLDFSSISTYTGCQRFTGNDSNQLGDVAGMFENGAKINYGDDKNWFYNDDYKIDIDEEYSDPGVATEFYKLTLTEENAGTVEFLQDVDYEFSLVLKTSTNWSAYMFDGIAKGTILDINTLGVSTNKGQGRAFSHVSFYVSDTYKDFTAKPKVRVPEPSSIAALAFIGGGMLLSRRRQSH